MWHVWGSLKDLKQILCQHAAVHTYRAHFRFSVLLGMNPPNNKRCRTFGGRGLELNWAVSFTENGFSCLSQVSIWSLLPGFCMSLYLLQHTISCFLTEIISNLSQLTLKRHVKCQLCLFSVFGLLGRFLTTGCRILFRQITELLHCSSCL